MPGRPIQIIPYSRSHRRSLLELMGSSRWAHSHLDFVDVADWLAGEDRLLLLAWQDRQLLGCLGLSPAAAGWRWIRLLGIRDGCMPGALLREMWARAESECRCRGDAGVALLALSNWLGTYLAGLDFRSHDDLITLQHIGSRLPREPDSPARLREVEVEDLERLWQIDKQAFAPPWQIERDDLWRTFRVAMSATVACVKGAIVGYQFCVRHGDVAHLARLAVHPACQGQGVASLMLHGLLSDLLEGNFDAITVNTQRSNLRSQRLYARFGFLRDGKDYPLWQKALPPVGEGA